MKHLCLIFVVISIPYLSVCSASEVSVTTQRYDNARTGQNLSERLLNTSNVNPTKFGKLFTLAVDDEIYAQPLYIPNVTLSNGDTRNVLYVATVNNSVYAFDADNAKMGGVPLWSVNLTPSGARAVQTTEVGCGLNEFSGNIGIVGTPVIDTALQAIYLVARTREGDQFVQRLHALNIATGAARPGSPVVIKASVQASGADALDGTLSFDSKIHNQRAALLLANDVVYIAWASHCDRGLYHGWIMAYDRTTLAQTFAKVTTPGGMGGGIWQSNSGPSADTSGNIYVTVGNGTVTAPKGGQDYGNAFLKLSPSGEVLDWFIPFNFEKLNRIDNDLGSAGVLLIPETNLLTSAGKEGKLYLLDRNNLGHFRPESDSQIVQSFAVGSRAPALWAWAGANYSTPTYWNGPGGPYVYTWPCYDYGKAFRLFGGKLTTTPASQTGISVEMPGGILSISADGKKGGTGILWAATGVRNANNKVVAGVLRAFDAADLSREIWNSKLNGTRDELGNLAKFNTPIVANGKVYVATFSKQIAVYGLLPKH